VRHRVPIGVTINHAPHSRNTRRCRSASVLAPGRRGLIYVDDLAAAQRGDYATVFREWLPHCLPEGSVQPSSVISELRLVIVITSMSPFILIRVSGGDMLRRGDSPAISLDRRAFHEAFQAHRPIALTHGGEARARRLR